MSVRAESVRDMIASHTTRRDPAGRTWAQRGEAAAARGGARGAGGRPDLTGGAVQRFTLHTRH